MRLFVLTNEPSPYQSSLLGALAAQEGVTLDVRFFERSSPADRFAETPRSFPHTVATGWGPRCMRGQFRLHPSVFGEVIRGKWTIYVLSGSCTSPTFLGCALILTLRRQPWVVWLERPREAYGAIPLWRHCARRLSRTVLGLVLRFTHGLFAIGSFAAQAYRGMGTKQDRTFVIPYAIAGIAYAAIPCEERSEVRADLEAGGKCVFLFSGQLVLRKGVRLLLECFGRLAAERSDVALWLLGDGPNRHELEQLARQRLGVLAADRIRFLGWRGQGQLPSVFAAADVFVFPSRHDGWAVVINEACSAGLPIIATEQTGAAHDLVEPGRNGYRLDRDDADGFLSAMRALADDAELRARFAARSRAIARNWNADAIAKRFLDAVATVLGQAGTDDSRSSRTREAVAPSEVAS